ncbi:MULTISPECIES: CHAP domain-containing protein [unclassified Breznakia]|uniref:CHAP domain-containing protein n=1 Tax=unclassified Breznakia TaxID=2623764 RepID=UPI002473B5E3|nr:MULTISPECIES: CHAP domain-containing protein [unclassified Breznakia]MDH6367395.1 surface antigen [Breznakia sp. PH1-1]MDH6403927.1 surface antigen [Breznakia sp. PF1-11]MDH6411636.1 surface antigen [Breznakia sp. PFB1-11]MDH6414562.1 surface antigen [Breznakia sp. PFB1-14]MDH6418668.1 surface antigen [Breznakia sp. PFB1-12]
MNNNPVKKSMQKIKRILTFGVGSFFLLFFILLLTITGVSGGGASAKVGEYYQSGEGLREKTEIYDKVIAEIKEEKDYQVYFYELAWYFSYLQKKPTYEDVKYIAKWIAENNPDTESLIKWYKEKSKFKDTLSGASINELESFIDSFYKIELALYETDSDATTSGTSSAGAKNVDFNSKWYKAPTNPSSSAGYQGQCTWYAWARSNEVFNGKYSKKPAGNARDWIAQWNEKSGQEPKKNSIAVWGGNGQHVAYIEEVKDGKITLTEGNYNSTKECLNYACSLDDAIKFTNTWTGTLDELKTRQGVYGRFLGFIYLE